MKKTTVLYAEDEINTRKDHITYLESRYDFNILEAKDGLEAWELYKKNKPEIVITDITMPNMDGLELARNIRKMSAHTKIIIATAHSEQEKLLEALDMYIVKYIIKPISRFKLNEAVSIAIETLSSNNVDKDDNKLFLSENVIWEIDTKELLIDNQPIKLSKSESLALDHLCNSKNIQVSSFDIFVNVWEELDKEYSSDSVRTLIKKLRKKLPEGCIDNIYGGYYKLNTK